MTRRPRVAGLLALCGALAACGGSPPPGPPAPPKPAAAAPSPPAATQPPTPPPPPAITYQARGRRDPFVSPETQVKAGGITVESAKLTGIVRGSTTLALVETADGIGYIMKPGDTLGDGRLVEIRADSVVFMVVPKPGSPTNRVTLKLATN